MEKAKARYFPDTDSLVIDIVPDKAAARTEEVAEDILIDYDENDQVVAIEFPGGVRELLAALFTQRSAGQEKARTLRSKGTRYATGDDK